MKKSKEGKGEERNAYLADPELLVEVDVRYCANDISLLNAKLEVRRVSKG